MNAQIVLIADILVRATPLMLTGLAIAIAFRAGVLNIGADGQLLMGATVAAWIGVSVTPTLGAATLPLALIAGTVAGGIWAYIAAILKTRFQVLEVISTIMLNFVATYTVSYLVRGPLQELTGIYPQTDIIGTTAQFTRLIPGTRLHWGIIIAIVLCIAAAWFMRKTVIGFWIRATGENPYAAQSAGQLDTTRITTYTFIVSGMIAGLAGAIEVSGVTFALYENLSPGYGYTGIAVALLAALRPGWIILTAIIFGLLQVMAGVLQRDANIPATLARVIEALLILAVIAIAQLRTRHRLTGSPV